MKNYRRILIPTVVVAIFAGIGLVATFKSQLSKRLVASSTDKASIDYDTARHLNSGVRDHDEAYSKKIGTLPFAFDEDALQREYYTWLLEIIYSKYPELRHENLAFPVGRRYPPLPFDFKSMALITQGFDFADDPETNRRHVYITVNRKDGQQSEISVDFVRTRTVWINDNTQQTTTLPIDYTAP